MTDVRLTWDTVRDGAHPAPRGTQAAPREPSTLVHSNKHQKWVYSSGCDPWPHASAQHVTNPFVDASADKPHQSEHRSRRTYSFYCCDFKPLYIFMCNYTSTTALHVRVRQMEDVPSHQLPWCSAAKCFSSFMRSQNTSHFDSTSFLVQHDRDKY